MDNQEKITAKEKTSNKKTSSPESGAENMEKKEMVLRFPIVGIGASAGGLAAFEAFFSGMPVDEEPGMAFVLVQHLAPDHESMLTNLISKYTSMQVFEVEDGMEVKPNCVYIIPPNRDLSLSDGKLQLLEPSAPRGHRLPIDFFFRSLAKERQESGIGIVLSGTGSDGTLGLRAIKGEGGMAMVQNPDSAEYDGMPRSALGTGLVDYELPPAEMPEQLLSFVSRAFLKKRRPVAPAPETINSLNKIFMLLRAQTGHDFSRYKSSAIHRRIERRMAMRQIEDMEKYGDYLHKNSTEVEALFRDLLIGVTAFFRDPEAFEAFEKECLPKLFEDKPSNTPLRIWVPGCSTGEEAYSLAILVEEYLEKHNRSDQVQIFSTDIDADAVGKARSGIYPASIKADISDERLSKYFATDSGESNGNPGFYRIKKNIREKLIFSEHNLIKDPPFSKLDLISCRNLLIYMNSELQKKVLSLFHYALKEGGYLFLGSSETVGNFSELFLNIHQKAKIYRHTESFKDHQKTASRILEPTVPIDEKRKFSLNERIPLEEKKSMKKLVEHELLEHLKVSGILINEMGDILYIHGRSGKYLEPGPGEFDRNIKKMIKKELKRSLSMALHKSIKSKSPVIVKGMGVRINGEDVVVDLTLRPIVMSTGFSSDNVLYLIVLEDTPLKEKEGLNIPSSMSELEGDEGKGSKDSRISSLLKELHEKEEYLQATNEELETSNEALKSSNDELQSMNEELQSTNEELETSKEELQSVNEELNTVNAELEAKVLDLSRVNSDMNNLLAGTGIATVFVDHKLNIMRFTPTATKIINLIRSDIGRPVGHIVSNLEDYDSLVEDIKEVLDTLIPKGLEVKTVEGKEYRMHIQPYRTLDNVIEGAVLTFINI